MEHTTGHDVLADLCPRCLEKAKAAFPDQKSIIALATKPNKILDFYYSLCSRCKARIVRAHKEGGSN